ncbi:hypothetical protein HDV04_001338 [Boothiomyces sp. JEL0838]|nr:hypothetical protein HDV04_001338 [Boothiomyces sp. JEL0838]
MHVLVMVAFYFLLYITSYSQLLGSDRILLAMCGPYSMINILHSMLNTSILTELKLILIAKLSKQKVPSVSKRLSTLFSIGQKRNNSQFIASTVEFCVSVLNIIITLAYYRKKDLTVINYWHILFGIVLLSNQGITKNFAEANIDWIFTLRVVYLEQGSWTRHVWVGLFLLMDALPRILVQFYYQTSIQSTGKCLLSQPQLPSLLKTALGTVYIGVVAIYFAIRIVKLIQSSNGGLGVQRLESLTVTSIAFALALCLIRTLIGIPFIMNIWPTVTPLLIPIQFTILPPICFLSIAYGSRLKVNLLPKLNSSNV